MSLFWGLGLGLGDGIFYALARDSYEIYLKTKKLNTFYTSFDIWKLILSGALLGLLAPLGYLWAAYSVGGLLDVHIIRCLVSALISILFSSYVFKDTVNGWTFCSFCIIQMQIKRVIISVRHDFLLFSI